MKYLDLSGNFLDFRSAIQLAKFVARKECGLVTLKVANADFDDSELAPVLEALRTNATVKVIDLSRNGVGGANDFYGAAAYSAKLRRLQARPAANGAGDDRKKRRESGVAAAKGAAAEKQKFLRSRLPGGFAQLALAKSRAMEVRGVAETLDRVRTNGSGCLELLAMLTRVPASNVLSVSAVAVSTGYPRRGCGGGATRRRHDPVRRLHGISTSRLRRRCDASLFPRNIHVTAAAAPRPRPPSRRNIHVVAAPWNAPRKIQLTSRGGAATHPFGLSPRPPPRRYNTTLVRLDLAWNRITVRDGELLGSALAGNRSLEWCSLAFNALEDAGAQQIGRALRSNPTLKHLDASGNGMGPRAASVFARALRDNDSLETLILDTNPLGVDGLRALSRSFNFFKGAAAISLVGCVHTGHEVARVACRASIKRRVAFGPGHPDDSEHPIETWAPTGRSTSRAGHDRRPPAAGGQDPRPRAFARGRAGVDERDLLRVLREVVPGDDPEADGGGCGGGVGRGVAQAAARSRHVALRPRGAAGVLPVGTRRSVC